jgi:hypothetical protein
MSSPVIRNTLATLEFDLMHFSWYNLFLIIRVAYEDIVKNPTQSTKDIFRFLEVNISENYLNKVSDMGKHDGASDREWNSVFRASGLSTATLLTWYLISINCLCLLL